MFSVSPAVNPAPWSAAWTADAPRGMTPQRAVGQFLHTGQLHDASGTVQRRRDHADASENLCFAEGVAQSIDVAEAVQQRQDDRVLADGRCDVEQGLLESVGLHRQQDEMVVAVDRVGGDQFRLQRQITVTADDLQPPGGQLRRPSRPHEEGHVAAGLDQAATEVPTGGAGSDHEDAQVVRAGVVRAGQGIPHGAHRSPVLNPCWRQAS